MAKNRFKDPANGDTYDWHINQGWDGEEDVNDYAFSWASTTGGAALPQFGGAKAQIKTLRGTILHLAQHTEFLAWAALSQEHTIYFRDVDGNEFEVVILAYRPRRIGVLKNWSDPVNMPQYIYRYEMQLLMMGEVA